MAYTLNNTPINIDAPYTAPDGTRYPNLRDPAIRAALGVVEVADEATYDQRFYWGVGNPKILDDIAAAPQEENGEPSIQKGLKSQWIAQVKDTAGKMLAQTDWMELRKLTRQIEIPAAIVTTRAAILAECERLETAIMSCTSVEELISIVNNQGWPRGD